MSAWICSRRHVAAVARWGAQTGLWVPLTPPQVADILLAENVRSVDARYRETNERPAPFTMGEIASAPALGDHAALKAINCLDYQSCESDDWQTTEACRLLIRAREHARGRGAHTGSGEYARTPWGLAEFDPQQRTLDIADVPL